METTNPLAESLEIPIDDPGATDANGKRWQGDDLDSWDEEDTWDDTETFGTHGR